MNPAAVDHRVIDLFIPRSHALDREAAASANTDDAAIKAIDSFDCQRRFLFVVDEVARGPMLDRLCIGACPARDHGRPSRHGLDRHEAKGLGPRSEHQRREGTRHQLVTLLAADLAAPVHDPFGDRGQNQLGEHRALRSFASLCRDHQAPPGATRHVDRLHDALFACQPAYEKQVVAPGSRGRRLREVQTMVDGRHPVGLRVPSALAVADCDERDVRVGVDQVDAAADVQSTVQGGHDRRRGIPGHGKRGGVDVGVQDVEAALFAPGVFDRKFEVLRDVTPVAEWPERTRHDRHDLARELRIAGPEDGHCVAPAIQPDSQGGNNPFCARVALRGQGEERRSDESDPERPGRDAEQRPIRDG